MNRPQEHLYLTREAIQHLENCFANHPFTPDPDTCELCAEIARAADDRLRALSERDAK